MKLRVEQEKGEILLAHIELDKLNAEMTELESIRNHYLAQIDFSDAGALADMAIRFQVELRDYFNLAQQPRKAVVKCYDRIGPLTQTYTNIVDTYFRGETPLDPTHFKVGKSTVKEQSASDSLERRGIRILKQ